MQSQRWIQIVTASLTLVLLMCNTAYGLVNLDRFQGSRTDAIREQASAPSRSPVAFGGALDPGISIPWGSKGQLSISDRIGRFVQRSAGQMAPSPIPGGGEISVAGEVLAWSELSGTSSLVTITGEGTTSSTTVPDGEGSMSLPVTTLSAGQGGQTLIFTYTAGPGGMENGALSIVIPDGWSAPSTSPADAGYTVASIGTVTAIDQAILISGITLPGGGALTISYGDSSGGGPGAIIGTATGLATFSALSMSSQNGTLTPLAVSPTVSVYADGMGTLTGSVTAVAWRVSNLTFTYQAAGQGMTDGTIALTVPDGWVPPSTSEYGPFYGNTTASTGTVSTIGQTIWISGVTLAGGSTMTITYARTPRGRSPAHITASSGQALFLARQQSHPGGVLKALTDSPVLMVYPDGAGIMTAPNVHIAGGQSGLTLPFTYAAGPIGMNGGTISLTVPEGWSPPSVLATDVGYVTSSTGSVSVNGQTITVSGVTLPGGGTLLLTYGDTSAGGPGSSSPSVCGPTIFAVQQKSVASPLSYLSALQQSPGLTVCDNGTGRLTLPVAEVSAGRDGQTLPFTYTADPLGMTDGSISLTIPDGWTPPSATEGPGYTAVSQGTVSVSGQTLTVSGITLAGGATLGITYGANGTATIGTTTGHVTFPVQQRSSATGTMTVLPESPGVTVYKDGEGTLALPLTYVMEGQRNLTLEFTYTAGASGINNGSVTLDVPNGWSAPSTVPTAPGYVTANAGAVSVSGRTASVTGVTWLPGQSFHIIYGDTRGGGPGATSPQTVTNSVFGAGSKASAVGVVSPLAASPSVAVVLQTGTMTLPSLQVGAGQTGLTVPFAYTAGPQGMVDGSLTLSIPEGWSVPSVVPSDPGYTTAGFGTVSVSGHNLTVAGITMPAGGTLMVTYGDRGGGGPGATTGPTGGDAVFAAFERSSPTNALAELPEPPLLHIYAADGSGSMKVIWNAFLPPGPTDAQVAFEYIADAGGLLNGSVAITIPSGWTPPTVLAGSPGRVTAWPGKVTVDGQTIVVSDLTLAEGDRLQVFYGGTSAGEDITVPDAIGPVAIATEAMSTANGRLTALAASPFLTVVAQNGSGTMTVGLTAVQVGQTGVTVPLTYTAAAGGMHEGRINVFVPSGWGVPSTETTAPGFTTASAGTIEWLSESWIRVSGVTLAGGETLSMVYGDRSGGGPGLTPDGPYSVTFFSSQTSAQSGTSTMLATHPTVEVYDADGRGTMTVSSHSVSASQAGVSLEFYFHPAIGGMKNGVVSLEVPAGWSAPSITPGTAGYTTASSGVVSVAGQTITVSDLTIDAIYTLGILYGSKSGGGPGATVGNDPGTVIFHAFSKSWSGGVLTALTTSPNKTVHAADGSGAIAVTGGPVAASQTGVTLTFTYTAGAGGMSNGAVAVTLPAGWSAPMTTPTSAGYTTAGTGVVSVAGQMMTVSALTLSAGQTVTVTYGSQSGGGPGATVGSDLGTVTFAAQSKSLYDGTLTALATPPSITVTSPDGSGTMTVMGGPVAASQTGVTLTFTYTAGAGGMNNGAVAVTLPAGWSAPTTTATSAGYTTAGSAVVSVSGQVFTVSPLTLSAGQTVTVTYGSKSGGGPGATIGAGAGTVTLAAQSKSLSGGTLKGLATSPSITVNAADGSGTMTVTGGPVAAGGTGVTLTFTYAAGAGGMSNGAVAVTLPAGWSAPTTTPTSAGYTTAGSGLVSVAGQVMTVSALTLSGGQTVTITYGNKSGGGPGATIGSGTGTVTFAAQSKSRSGGTLTALASSPSTSVVAPDGSGTTTVMGGPVVAGQTGVTLTFTYTAGAGGMYYGAITVTLPDGWSSPTNGPPYAGYTTSSSGTVVNGAAHVLTVGELFLDEGETVTITYGNKSGGGPGATIGSGTGTVTFAAQSKSLSGGTLTALASSPSTSVVAPDGNGTMTVNWGPVAARQTGVTRTFTYTAGPGGMSNGSITVTLPPGWSAPTATSTAAGYTTSSSGLVSGEGQVLTVSDLTLNSGQTVTITYGDKGGGGPGATVGSETGTVTFVAQSKSFIGGTLTALATSPSTRVYAADGSGTVTVRGGPVAAGQTDLTLTFTYTAGPGGMYYGDITVTLPDGWTVPTTAFPWSAGYTESTLGIVHVAGQVLTVSPLVLNEGETGTITYARATAGSSVAAIVVQSKSVSSGTLTTLSSPLTEVYAPDGSGTAEINRDFAMGEYVDSVRIFYTASAGGINNGTVEITVPTGWPMPNRTSPCLAGYASADQGSVSVDGQIITVSGVMLAEGHSLVVEYGSNQCGGGVTVPLESGPYLFGVKVKSTEDGILTSLADSPVVTVNAVNGSGTMTLSPTEISAGQKGLTLVFTYTVGPGGMSRGSVSVGTPLNWTPPSTTPWDAGYVTASHGLISCFGRFIDVYDVTLPAGATLTITYGERTGGGGGVSAPIAYGKLEFDARSESNRLGPDEALATSPSLWAYAYDGDGSLTTSIESSSTVVTAGETGATLPFTFTAPYGGIKDGALTITVPEDWSAPSIIPADPGFATSSRGVLTVADRTITITGLTLAAGETVLITYGDQSGGGPGVTPPWVPGPVDFVGQEKSTEGGSLKTLLGWAPTVYVEERRIVVISPHPGHTLDDALTVKVTSNFDMKSAGVVLLQTNASRPLGSAKISTDKRTGTLQSILPMQAAGVGIVQVTVTDTLGYLYYANVAVMLATPSGSVHPATVLIDPGLLTQPPASSADPLAIEGFPGFATTGPSAQGAGVTALSEPGPTAAAPASSDLGWLLTMAGALTAWVAIRRRFGSPAPAPDTSSSSTAASMAATDALATPSAEGPGVSATASTYHYPIDPYRGLSTAQAAYCRLNGWKLAGTWYTYEGENYELGVSHSFSDETRALYEDLEATFRAEGKMPVYDSNSILDWVTSDQAIWDDGLWRVRLPGDDEDTDPPPPPNPYAGLSPELKAQLIAAGVTEIGTWYKYDGKYYCLGSTQGYTLEEYRDHVCPGWREAMAKLDEQMSAEGKVLVDDGQGNLFYWPIYLSEQDADGIWRPKGYQVVTIPVTPSGEQAGIPTMAELDAHRPTEEGRPDANQFAVIQRLFGLTEGTSDQYGPAAGQTPRTAALLGVIQALTIGQDQVDSQVRIGPNTWNALMDFRNWLAAVSTDDPFDEQNATHPTWGVLVDLRNLLLTMGTPEAAYDAIKATLDNADWSGTEDPYLSAQMKQRYEKMRDRLTGYLQIVNPGFLTTPVHPGDGVFPTGDPEERYETSAGGQHFYALQHPLFGQLATGALNLNECEQVIRKVFPEWYEIMRPTFNFEGLGWLRNCVGDGDGQGASVGIIQWNFGQKSLQPLLKTFADRHPGLWSQVFRGDRDTELYSHLATDPASFPANFAWLRANVGPMSGDWVTDFDMLCATREFQELQLEFLEKPGYWTRAKDYARSWGFTSRRGLADVFNAHVQSGWIDADDEDVQNVLMNHTGLTLRDEGHLAETNWQFLERCRLEVRAWDDAGDRRKIVMIAEVFGAQASAEYSDDVYRRHMENLNDPSLTDANWE